MSLSIGEILRSKREEKKLSLLQVSQGTNIRVPFLEAIEQDRLDAIPSLAQARGFVRLYAGYLGLDPTPLLHVETKIEEQPANPEGIEKPSIRVQELHPVKPPRVSEYLQNKLEKLLEKIPAPKKTSEGIKPISGQEAGSETSSGAASQVILSEIGRELETQRESLGLSRADVERQTRIREYYIEALESGNLENLPSTVQGRGILGNYAQFMNLDSNSLQLRFADALQQRRLELALTEVKGKPSLLNGKIAHKPAPAWKKYLTPDLIVSGGLFLILFVFVAWGASQVIKSSSIQPLSSPGSISEFLLYTQTAQVPGTEVSTLQVSTATPQSTSASDAEVTQTSIGTGPIQVVVIVHQRAYLRVTVDGDVEFDQRVVPGNSYTFSGNESIQLLTGDGSAIQVIYNQEDLGILGGSGEVINMNYTLDGAITPTPRFTSTPTATKQPTLTPQPTATVPPPTPTSPLPTP